MKLAQLIDINMNNIFRKYFAWFGKLYPKSGPFITLPTYQISQNQLWWVCGFLFWWMYAFGQSKKQQTSSTVPIIICLNYTTILSKS